MSLTSEEGSPSTTKQHKYVYGIAYKTTNQPHKQDNPSVFSGRVLHPDTSMVLNEMDKMVTDYCCQRSLSQSDTEAKQPERLDFDHNKYNQYRKQIYNDPAFSIGPDELRQSLTGWPIHVEHNTANPPVGVILTSHYNPESHNLYVLADIQNPDTIQQLSEKKLTAFSIGYCTSLQLLSQSAGGCETSRLSKQDVHLAKNKEIIEISLVAEPFIEHCDIFFAASKDHIPDAPIKIQNEGLPTKDDIQLSTMNVQETRSIQSSIEQKTNNDLLPTTRTIMATNTTNESATTPTVEDTVAPKPQTVISNNTSIATPQSDATTPSIQGDEMQVVETKNTVIVEPNRDKHNILSDEENGMVMGFQHLFDELQTTRNELQKAQHQLAETQKTSSKQAYIKSTIAAIADPTKVTALTTIYSNLAQSDPTMTIERFCSVMGLATQSNDKQIAKNTNTKATLSTPIQQSPEPMQQVNNTYSDMSTFTTKKRNFATAINQNDEDENIQDQQELDYVQTSLDRLSSYNDNFSQLVQRNIDVLNSQPTPLLKVGQYQMYDNNEEREKFQTITSSLPSNTMNNTRAVIQLFPCLAQATQVINAYYNKQVNNESKNKTTRHVSKLSKTTDGDVTQMPPSSKILQQLSTLHNSQALLLSKYYIKPNLYTSAIDQMDKLQQVQQSSKINSTKQVTF